MDISALQRTQFILRYTLNHLGERAITDYYRQFFYYPDAVNIGIAGDCQSGTIQLLRSCVSFIGPGGPALEVQTVVFVSQLHDQVSALRPAGIYCMAAGASLFKFDILLACGRICDLVQLSLQLTCQSPIIILYGPGISDILQKLLNLFDNLFRADGEVQTLFDVAALDGLHKSSFAGELLSKTSISTVGVHYELVLQINFVGHADRCILGNRKVQYLPFIGSFIIKCSQSARSVSVNLFNLYIADPNIISSRTVAELAVYTHIHMVKSPGRVVYLLCRLFSEHAFHFNLHIERSVFNFNLTRVRIYASTVLVVSRGEADLNSISTAGQIHRGLAVTIGAAGNNYIVLHIAIRIVDDKIAVAQRSFDNLAAPPSIGFPFIGIEIQVYRVFCSRLHHELGGFYEFFPFDRFFALSRLIRRFVCEVIRRFVCGIVRRFVCGVVHRLVCGIVNGSLPGELLLFSLNFIQTYLKTVAGFELAGKCKAVEREQHHEHHNKCENPSGLSHFLSSL